MFINKKQAGFTLVELMVSIVLGLIIVAAATQLFITGQASLNLQRSMAEIQDNGNFGLNYLLQDIRKANLDAVQAVINDRNLYGGIVLTGLTSYPTLTEAEQQTISANLPYNLVASKVPKVLLTRGAGQTVGSSNQWTGVTNITGKSGDDTAISTSDQLVIQYKAVEVNTTDCEGQNITQQDIDDGTYIVQRYFLRKDGNNNNDLALACDAGRYKTNVSTLPTEITGYGGGGEILMRRVDHFHILLGVKENDSDEFRYMSVNDYMGNGTNDMDLTTTIPRPRIMSIQLGMLVRGADITNDSLVTGTQEYNILDQKVKLTNDAQASGKYLRQVITQTVALRNGYGLTESL
ncbi:PilW family protein [Alkanindiges sp. WGS2144]|uniref:PilW family protein n=1 Tax=Alkanindiges sp. WGS2144 TaxID=3366808 RepID=UPI00375066C4